MRTVSNAFRQALYARESDEVAVSLLTITHPQLAQPIRLSTDPTTRLSEDPLTYGTISRGQQYLFVPVYVVLPPESDDAAPAAALEIDNTDLGLVTAVRSIGSAANVKIEIVLASAPDTVEITFPEMTVVSVSYDAEAMRFDLAIEALFSEPFPGNYFVPSVFPALF